MDNLELVENHREIYKSLVDALETLKKLKPNDRSEIDRRFAIVITDLEKIIVYVDYYFTT